MVTILPLRKVRPPRKTGDVGDGGNCPSQVESQLVAPTISTHSRQRRGTTRGRGVPASSEEPESCHQGEQTTPMDGAVQPGRGGTLRSTVQDRNEEGRGPPITEHMEPEPAVPAAPSTGGHTPGRRGGATTVDGGRDRCSTGPSACQSQKGTRLRWDTEQCVDHRTSSQSRDT